MLAYLAHQEDKPPIVVSLIEPDGTIVTDPPLVANKFLGFYGELYSSQCNYTPEEIQAYLHTIQFPLLSLEQIQVLEASITTQDIDTAISQLAKSKAPGLDGLPLHHILRNTHSKVEDPVPFNI